MTTPVCTIDAAGIHKPDYETIRAYVVDAYKAIYGDDVYVAADSQDGQLLSLFAQAIHDCNAMAVAVYNSFSPAKAQGEGLSSNVKLNGITRKVASLSTVDLRIVGEVGTIIEGGVASDDTGARWLIPTVTIPISGEITVTATSKELGAVSAPANTVNQIATPTRGWQSVNNPAAATPGAPVETDAALRARQAISTALAAQTPVESVVAAIAALPGVSRVAGYENDTNATDSRGLPPHSLSIIVDGGDDTQIAQIIAKKKTIGTSTYGSTTVSVADSAGVPRPMRFSRPNQAVVIVQMTIRALPGYSSARLAAIKQAIADWINSLSMGDDVIYTRVFMPANLWGDTSKGSQTFEITALQIGRSLGSLAAADIVTTVNEAPTSAPDYINITVTT